MLKLGCMSLSYKDEFGAGKLDLEQFIERAYQLRLDGIDLHTRAFGSLEPDYLRKIRMQALKRGIALSYIGVSSNFGKPLEELENEVTTAKQWIDVAAFMGIPLVRVFAAWIPEGDNEEDVLARMTPCLKEVAAYGEEKGVVVGLHNHNHGCIPATGDQVIRLLDDVDNPYYTHILDTGQYRGSPGASFGKRGQEDPQWNFYGSIETSAPRAVHVRAKIYRIASGKEAWLDYERILPIIKNVGYNGWMSIVFEGQDELDEPAAVPLANSYLRSMLAKHEM